MGDRAVAGVDGSTEFQHEAAPEFDDAFIAESGQRCNAGGLRSGAGRWRGRKKNRVYD